MESEPTIAELQAEHNQLLIETKASASFLKWAEEHDAEILRRGLPGTGRTKDCPISLDAFLEGLSPAAALDAGIAEFGWKDAVGNFLIQPAWRRNRSA